MVRLSSCRLARHHLLTVTLMLTTAYVNCFSTVGARPSPIPFGSKFSSISKKQQVGEVSIERGYIRNGLNVRGGGQRMELFMAGLSPTVASLLAGSVAGAIGVGVAFPLDTLKTRSQVMGQPQANEAATETGNSNSNNIGMFELIQLIYAAEGIKGFFGGVRGMMIGQAFIKAVAFGTNGWMLVSVNDAFPHISTFNSLITAAAFAGFMASFLVAPFERVKVMMQASDDYTSELQTVEVILKTEGLKGLLTRGLGPTLAREIPSYGIYFVTYGLLMQTAIATIFGSGAPLIAGAAAGCACWIPVYPIDVVKTLVQNTAGDGEKDAFKIMRELYKSEGIGGFFDGLTPKMYRAMVNHATTFWLYDLIMTYYNNAVLI